MNKLSDMFPGLDKVQEHCFKVSEITLLIKATLEHDFSRITILGEISNFRPSSTGHWYFSLKDEDAIISAVMFRNRLERLAFLPEDGMLVKATGSISVYAKRGNYQIICEELAPAGQGNILALLEKKKQELARKGYFAPEKKRPLPLFPSRVAVITSPTGAAIQDILRVLSRRNAGINLVILPAPVQGEQAPPLLARQLRVANLHKLGEVIILARGGGSLEDLLPFYSEEVVKAIYESEIPVISAVGHEIDVSFSDLAADYRAPTPSAAAEVVSASTAELVRRVENLESSMTAAIKQRLAHIRLLVNQFSTENIERNFRIYIQPVLLRFDDLKEALIDGLKARVRDTGHRLELVSRQLEAHSPLAVLKRGYAVVTRKKNHEVLLSAEAVQPGEQINVRLYEGKLTAVVKEQKS